MNCEVESAQINAKNVILHLVLNFIQHFKIFCYKYY